MRYWNEKLEILIMKWIIKQIVLKVYNQKSIGNKNNVNIKQKI